MSFSPVSGGGGGGGGVVLQTCMWGRRLQPGGTGCLGALAF